MKDTVARFLAGISASSDREALRAVINPIADRCSTQVLSTPGLAIKTGGSAIVKAGTAFYACVQGILLTKAANTDMAALSGAVTNAKFNVYCFYVDSAGTLTSAMGAEGATLATVKWPEPPQGKAMIGFVIINPTGTGNFVGGTTALDDATVVPNAVYVNTVGDFDPSILLY